MLFQEVVDKGQTASLTTQRSFTDAGKVGVGVEAIALEDSHHTLIFHLAVLHDGIEDDLSVSIYVLQTIPCNRAQEFSDREDGATIEPTAHVVTADMV